MGQRAKYTIVAQYADRLIIRDVGPWDKHMTVTNDAENVVKELAKLLNGRMLLYIDSEGELGRLHVRDGKFAGFAPVP
jgi:hypothetical protein